MLIFFDKEESRAELKPLVLSMVPNSTGDEVLYARQQGGSTDLFQTFVSEISSALSENG